MSCRLACGRRRRGCFTDLSQRCSRYGLAYKRVKVALHVEEINNIIGMNVPWSLGVGYHPTTPGVTIHCDSLATWTGQTPSQCQGGLQLLRKLRDAHNNLAKAEGAMAKEQVLNFEAFEALLKAEPFSYPLSRAEEAAVSLSIASLTRICKDSVE